MRYLPYQGADCNRRCH
ncbi:hypothetical protein D041_0760A, partial [Vibrio parahaemolyticus EKP-008]